MVSALLLMSFLNSPFRFRPVKVSVPTESTPESYFTSFPGFSTNTHVSRIRKKREISVKVGALLWLVRISGVCVSRAARVNVNNSQGHGPPKTSDINFQPPPPNTLNKNTTRQLLWPFNFAVFTSILRVFFLCLSFTNCFFYTCVKSKCCSALMDTQQLSLRLASGGCLADTV